ncbi:peptide-N4-(N-acetyl-beta-glucosaminyl)asparagine amidase A-like [Mangifera indica]|uniref:peptide-N4-(N-acetyl-beta- glucosaminyl)asparagine amidase A-like n=1 Tax=Mangifera indica TaxID=29780 RepID=UPI001CFA3E3F|nr:peptide-N4-(N-acetyl-beta-glucosaminyl)asparagine amidase A-like [Mangifera indica]
MASFHFILFLLFSLFLSASANLHKTKSLFQKASNDLYDSQLLTASLSDTPPTTYFEVTRPINHPKTRPCSHHILSYDFGYTLGRPPVTANYTRPTHCSAREFSSIFLELKATSKGRQFDRIFGVWLGGVELLRSCTAEPRATGIEWSVEKDITRYHSLLLKNETQTFAVFLGNAVDETQTGVYHVDITMHFHPAEEGSHRNKHVLKDNSKSGYSPMADLILPISKDFPGNNGLWFEIENSNDVQAKEFKIPQYVYRAVLEVYVSFHENDEFWYANLPNDYIAINHLTDHSGNGPFREVVVTLDGQVVGAVWPFTVVYTGGINPLFWRPITGIGSFNLPTYDIEITPFLGNILDGETHRIGFSVSNALNVWYIDANLHLWLDSDSMKTEGKLLQLEAAPFNFNYMSSHSGVDGSFSMDVSRAVSSTGWVKSSWGTITTSFVQDFSFSNSMIMGKRADLQMVNQTIHFNDRISANTLSSNVHSAESSKMFSLYIYSDTSDQGNGVYLAVANVSLGFHEKKSEKAGNGFSGSTLNSLQNGQAVMFVKDHLINSGVGSTQQLYQYSSGNFCYFRNVSSSNYTILHDKVGHDCNQRNLSEFSFGSSKLPPSSS